MSKVMQLVALVTALLLSSCTQTPLQPEPATPPPRLVVATPHREAIYKPLVTEFQQRTGIWVQVITAGTPLLLSGIADGSLAVDVIFGGGVDSLAAYSDYFVPYHSPELVAVDPTYCPADGSYTPFSTLPIVFFYNTKQLPYGTAPTSWAQLLDPQWQGKVAFADPSVSSSCYTALCTAILAQPERPPAEVIDSLFNVVSLQSGSSRIYEAVADGSLLIGITLEESAIRQGNLRHDVNYLYPSDGTSALPDGTAILVGCQNLDAAQAFVDFTIDKATQQMLVSSMARRAVRTDIEVGRGQLPLSRIAQVDYNLEWSTDNRELILGRWKAIANPDGEVSR